MVRDCFKREPKRNGNLQKSSFIAVIANRGIQAGSKDVEGVSVKIELGGGVAVRWSILLAVDLQ